MTTEHPITPPPELVQQWLNEDIDNTCSRIEHLTTQAARWGADQELEACHELLRTGFPGGLMDARRPKPLSLKEEALSQLESIQSDLSRYCMGSSTDAIRRALEALPE